MSLCAAHVSEGQGSFWQPSPGLLAEQLCCDWLGASYLLPKAPKAVKRAAQSKTKVWWSTAIQSSLKQSLHGCIDRHNKLCLQQV